MAKNPAGLVRLGASESLARLLEEPGLVKIVQALSPEALSRLIDHVGLEDSGEILSLATTGQLVRLLDDDLWKSDRPGVDESFDADRFVLWLEVLLESGEKFTAKKLADWPEDLVMLALYKQLLVINLDELAVEMDGRRQDVDLTEKALDSCLYIELGEYQLISRQADGWNTVVAVVLALDEHQPELLQRLLERCCRLSRETIEQSGGLYQVLTSEEMLEADAAGERQDRRAAEGYVAPSSAKAFLRLAEETDLSEIIDSDQEDPVTRSYFRDMKIEKLESPALPGRQIGRILKEAGIPGAEQPVALLDDPESRGPDTFFRRAVFELAGQAPNLYSRRMREMAYLANLLMAGHSISGRRYRPAEAAGEVIRLCNAGLLHLVGPDDYPAAVKRVRDESAVKLFRIGWHLSGSG